MTKDNGLKSQAQRLNDAMHRVVTAAANVPEVLMDQIRNDVTAECMWWNGLQPQERLAYVGGAKGSPEYAGHDWLDIGETNRMRILDAAHAVQCWLTAVEEH